MVGRKSKLLDAFKIKSLDHKGKYSDGDGLYLQISKWGTKSWIYRYQLNGRRREMGLGSINDLTLAEARKVTRLNRDILLEGRDPKIVRDSQKQDMQKRQAWTFDRCAEAYIKAHGPSWKNQKHLKQWESTLAKYASPVLGTIPAEEIDKALIMRVIEPLWLTKNETASRLRGRLERILSWAIVNDYRDYPNPAIWRGNLQELLPARAKVLKTSHHNAMPYSELSIFMPELRQNKTMAARALEFTILTALRTKEVLGASWDEIDFQTNIWTIPEDRMKSGREHRVPLSSEAISILNSLNQTGGWVFASPTNPHKHLNHSSMLVFLQGTMKRPRLTVHGFRSTFRDWVAETTNHPREIAEIALAHVNKDKTEAAYQRGDLLEKRRLMMQDYSNFAYSKSDNIRMFK